jgi:tyrosyl-DNA phosphodiesterase 1
MTSPPPQKRRKTLLGSTDNSGYDARSGAESAVEADQGNSLTRAISPPRRKALTKAEEIPQSSKFRESSNPADPAAIPPARVPRVLRSPFQLNRIDGLPPADNVDTIGLCDIVGHPLIRKCWVFNYCIDIDFLM